MDDNIDAKQILTSSPSVLEETTRTTTDDLDEDGAERPRLPRAVMHVFIVLLLLFIRAHFIYF